MHLEAMSARRKTAATATLVIALVLEIVDQTIVNTALPAIRTDLGGVGLAAQWVVASYSLSFAMLLMLGGRLGDLVGYRRMFLVGVAGFTLSSAACGAAPGIGALIAARIAQGVTGAMMAPQVMALMQVMFNPVERISRMALFGVVGGLAAIAGPVLGGALIAANWWGLGWRLVFLVNLPVGALAITAALFLLPHGRSERAGGIDLGAAAVFALAMAALVGPMMDAGRAGALPRIVSGVFVAAGLLVWVWVHARRRANAGQSLLFDPSLFQIATFRLGLVACIAFAIANAGFLLIFAYALQNERHWSPMTTGLMHVPFSVGVMAGIAFIGRRFLPRFGRRVPQLALSTMALAITGILLTMPVIGVPALAGLAALAGIGMGAGTGSLGPIAVAQIERAHAGAASGLIKTCQQGGAAMGVALVGGAYFAGQQTANQGRVAALIVVLIALTASLTAALILPTGIFKAPTHR